MRKPWTLLRANSQPGEDDNVPPCLKWVNRERLAWIVVIVLIVILAGLIIGLTKCANQEKDESSQDGKVCSLTSGPDADTITGIELCINEQKSTCRNSTCFSCKDEIVPHFEPLNCPGGNILNIKNESCFQCSDDCLTFQDLLDNVKEGTTSLKCPGKVDISCCVLSTMGNLGYNLGENGKCNCYKEPEHNLYNKSLYEPICTCPVGSETKGCDKTYTQTARCKCLKSTYTFCGQEQIIECDSENIRSNWTKCHRVITKDDSEYKCMCTKPTATEPASDLRSCSDLDST